MAMLLYLMTVRPALAQHFRTGQEKLSEPSLVLRIDTLHDVSSDHVIPGTPVLAASGIGLGAAGALSGWFIGGQLTNQFEGALIGAALGETILLPLGVHLASRGRGRYPVALAISTGVGAAGLLYVFSQYTDASLALASIVVPIVQLTFSIADARGAFR
ncbi:MAG TPA: hypothetical protein VHG28_00870 [Longimicrobiaceae bacterium]|nr:hypothetical protein [Longimicrobiaceae bacterium]